MSAPSQQKQASKKSQAAEIPLLEWICGGIGLVIVLFSVGVLVYEAVAGDDSPPDITLTVQAITPLRQGFLVKVRADNQGGESAARVAVAAELTSVSQVLEASETQFEFLPPHSSRDAGVFFTHDPRQGEIRLRALGYEEP